MLTVDYGPRIFLSYHCYRMGGPREAYCATCSILSPAQDYRIPEDICTKVSSYKKEFREKAQKLTQMDNLIDELVDEDKWVYYIAHRRCKYTD